MLARLELEPRRRSGSPAPLLPCVLSIPRRLSTIVSLVSRTAILSVTASTSSSLPFLVSALQPGFHQPVFVPFTRPQATFATATANNPTDPSPSRLHPFATSNRSQDAGRDQGKKHCRRGQQRRSHRAHRPATRMPLTRLHRAASGQARDRAEQHVRRPFPPSSPSMRPAVASPRATADASRTRPPAMQTRKLTG